MGFKKIFILIVLLLIFPFYLLFSTESSSNLTERMMNFVIQVGIIIFVAKFGAIIFEKLKLPSVLGELISGMIIGPYFLGSVPLPGFKNGLFPEFEGFAVTPELYALCTLASIVLLFIVGLETDLRLFLKYSIVGGLVGLFGVIFSFFGGDIIAVLFSKFISDKPINFLSSEAMFLGTISTATSVGITARILSERKKLDTSEGVTILAGAVIDDVLGIITLALVVGILTASKVTGSIDWMHIGLIATKTIGIWLIATIIGLLLSHKIGVFLKFFKNRSIISLLAFGLALLLSGLFEHAGLAMIIGAYVMGLSLSRTDVANLIKEKLEGIYELFIPIFFCVMGMLVNFKALTNINIIIFGIIYSIVAILSKIIGCSLPTLFFNFNLRGATRIGVGMVPRGEVALIVAGMGLSYGFLPNHIFGVSIIMTLLTTLLAPVMLLKVFNEKKGTKTEEKHVDKRTIEIDFPSLYITNLILTEFLKAFEKEGFFVHLVDHNENIYQLRKDEIIIILKKEELKIKIDISNDKEEKLVYTALYFVIGEFENIIKGLMLPFDKKAIAKKLQKNKIDKVEDKEIKPNFELSNYLKPDFIKVNLKGKTKYEIIDELVNFLCKVNNISNIEEIKNAILEREKSMSTGLQDGIAIPHGRTDAVSKLVCAIGIKKEGIDFESLDGKPSKIFIITVSPKNYPAPHIQFMSAILQSLTEENKKLLCEAKSAKEAYFILCGEKE